MRSAISSKNLRHAEKLPHQLHEKIAEFQAQLTIVNDAEKEELEKELVALRTSESDRLDSVSDKIAKSTADWTRLEAATEKHLAAATEALGQAQAKAAATLAALDAKLSALESAAKSAPVAEPPTAAAIEAAPAPAPVDAPPAETVSHPPKRPRKPRREEPAPEEKPAADESPAVSAAPPTIEQPAADATATAAPEPTPAPG
jgi:hypothetical protein